MHQRQALALLFRGWRVSLARAGRCGKLIGIFLAAAGLLSAVPGALAGGNTSHREEAAHDFGPATQPLTKEEIRTVLPLLSKYSETRQLVADLEISIKQGDLPRARQLVEQLMDASTFAALTSDWLNRMLHVGGAPGATVSPQAGDGEARELRKALEEEQDRNRSLARERALITDRVADLEASHERAAAAEAELRQALQREQERSRALETQVAGLSASSRETHERAAAAEAELRQALQREQERSRAPARKQTAVAKRLADVQTTQSIANRPQDRARADLTISPAGRADPWAARLEGARMDGTIIPDPASPLVARAAARLRTGDIIGARLLLERASQSGDAAAMHLLAATFDPSVLGSLGVVGVRGDVLKAGELYARAQALREAQGAVAPADRPAERARP